MLRTRQELEEIEARTLAPYAMPSRASRGRRYPEPEHPIRTIFQRDRDRIIHSAAFRRLKAKDFAGTLLGFVDRILDSPRAAAPKVAFDFWHQFDAAEQLEELRQYRPSAYHALPEAP